MSKQSITPNTMKHSLTRTTSRIVSAFLLASFCLTTGAQATTIVKENNADNLNLTTSWVGGVVPTSSDVAQWDSTVAAANATLLGADTNWLGIIITNPAGAVTINAGNTLTLGSAGIDMSGASQNLTLNNRVLLGAGQLWSVGSGRSLTVAAGLGGSGLLTKSGAGALYIAGVNTNTGGISITGGTVQTSSGGNTTDSFGTNTLSLSNGGRARFNNASTSATVNNPLNIGTGGGVLSFRANSYYGSPPLSGSGTLTIQLDNGVVFTPTSFQNWNGRISVLSVGAGGTCRLDNGYVDSLGSAALDLGAGIGLARRNGTSTTLTASIGTLSGAASSSFGGSAAGAGTMFYNIGGRNEDSTFAGSFINGGSKTAVTKVGSGQFTISGTNTYTGPTLVSTGALNCVTGGSISNSASITVASNATFGVQVATSGGRWAGTNLLFNAGTNFLVFNYGTVAPSTTTAPLLLLSNITANGTVKISVLGGAGWAVGPYPLVKYSGAIAGTGSINNLLALPLQVSATVSNDAVNSVLYLVVSASSEPLRWAAGSGYWDIGVSSNWTNAIGTTTTYQEQLGLGDAVVFDDSGTGPSVAVTLSTNVTPQSVIVNNANTSYSISGGGAIAGTVGLTKQGSGTLTMRTTNTFTGVVNLNGGIVNFSALNNLGAGTAINFGGGTLQFASGNTTDISTRTVAINAGGATIDTAGNNVTFANRLGSNGAGGLAKAGAGILTLNSNVTCTGNAAISQGTLALGANGSLSNSPAIIVGSGSVLDVSATTGLTLNGLVGQVLAGSGVVTGGVTVGASTVVTPVTNGTIGTLSFTNDLTLDGGTFNLDVGAGSRDLIIVSGTLNLNSGTFNVNVVGSPLPNGTYKLIQYASYNYGLGAGNILLSGFAQGGQFAYLDDSSPGQINLIVTAASSLSLTWAGDGAANSWDVAASANWLTNPASPATFFANGDYTRFDDSSANLAVSLAANVFPSSVLVSSTNDYTFTANGGKIVGSTGLTKSGSGKLTLLAPNAYSGPTVITAGTLQVGDGATGGAAIGVGNVTNNASLVFNQPDDFTVKGAISGTGALTKAGAGILTLLGNNTYGGPTLVDTGTLQIGNGGALGTPGTAAITLANGATLILNRSGVQSFANGISGVGTFQKSGPSTLTFAGVNTYVNNTYINNGTLKLGIANAIPWGGATTGWLIMDGSATVAGILDLNGFDQTVNALSGLADTVRGQILNNGGSGLNTLTVNGVAGLADTTYAGTIADNSGSGGTVSLVKRGTSNLTLANAASTYSGGTVLYEGTLTLSSTTSTGGHCGTGQITFQGGTLASGFGGGSRLTIGNALFVPAASSGTIVMSTMETLSGALTGAGTLTVNVQGSDDRLSGNWTAFTGTVNLYGGGTAKMYINGGGFGAGWTSSTLTLTNVTLTGSQNSGGNTVNAGGLVVDSTATVGGSFYGGGLTLSVGALNQADLIAGTFTDDPTYGGTSLIKVGTNTLSLTGTISHRGNTTVNAGTLWVGASSWMGNSPVITVAAGARLDVSAVGGLTLSANQILAGGGVITGAVTLVATDALNPGGSAAAGTLSFSNSLTLDGVSGAITNAFDLSDDPTGLLRANDQVVVAGDLNVAGANLLELNPLNTSLGVGTYTLFKVHGSLLNGGSPVPNGAITNYLQLTGAFLTQTRAPLLLSNYANQVVLVVGSGPSLVWLGGDGATNKWDVTNTLSWVEGAARTNFHQLDSLTFNDTATNFVAMLSGNLAPSTISVDTVNTYGFGSSGKLTGGASLTKSGTGMLVISNTTANDYDGQVAISAGTLKMGIASALGSTNGATVINGGTLDVNGLAPGAERIQVQGGGLGGNGAIVNNGAQLVNAGFTGNLTLTGDTTLGGSNRWDIYNGSLTGNAHKLTKVGANYIVLTGLGETGLGNIDVQQGYFTFIGNTTMGAPGNTLALWPGARIDFYGSTITNNKVVQMTNAIISSSNGTNYFAGPITVTGTATVTAGTPLVLSGGIGGGALVKDGASTLTLTAANTYGGITTISNGVLALTTAAAVVGSPTLDVVAGALDVSALPSGLLTLGSGQTLKGGGTVYGSVAAPANSTVSPGDGGTGTFTVTNTISLGGTTLMDINRDTAPARDQIVAATIHYGGTLTVQNLGSEPQEGDFFKLFSGAVSGSFTKVTLPSLPTGFEWQDTLAANGTIAVIASPVNLTPTNIVVAVNGSQLTLSWPDDHTGWFLQTNAVDLVNTSDWFTLPGSDTTNKVIITVNPALPKVFYRMMHP